MRKVYCFISRQKNLRGDIWAFLEKLDRQGDTIYLYYDLEDRMNDPDNIIHEMDQVMERNDLLEQKLFITDIPGLFFVIYRLYHQTFDQFLYYRDESFEYNLPPLYERIMSLPINIGEELFKPIYSNCDTLSWCDTSFETRDYQLIGEDGRDSGEGKSISDIKERIRIRKYYLIDGVYYLYEPVLSDEKRIINLDKPSNASQEYAFPGFQKLQYMHDFDHEIMKQLFCALDSLTEENIGKIHCIFQQLEQDMNGYSYFTYYITCSILDDAAWMNDPGDIVRCIAILSFLMQVTKENHYLNTLIKHGIENICLNENHRYFLWNQCKRYGLEKKISSDADTKGLLKRLYRAAFDGYERSLAEQLVPIPKEERNIDLIVVFTIQFLSERHAPTRTTLERCYTIAKLLGKKLILINTCEQYTEAGQLIVYNQVGGTVIEEYSGASHYQYKDMMIPYYQPKATMPSRAVIGEIVSMIREWRPAFIISIGNGSLTADLCGRIVPQAAISVAFSTLATTMATFSVIGRKIKSEEWEDLQKKGYSRDSIIESTFTFELNPRISTVTREEFSIPGDKFVLVVVGIRLDSEVDDNFVKMLNKTFAWGTHVVFAGCFERYDHYCQRYAEFKTNSTFIGYCNDILALMQICDLYVNPRRLGGGFSIVEAFHEGKPGITVDYGDVAVSGGPDFCVKDYEEMLSTIQRYITDRGFYELMSQKAREREQVVTDSKGAMENIIKKIQSSPLFF